MKFNYQKSLQEDYPIVEIKASSGTDYVKIYALIDSGATMSIFKEEVAEILGINIRSGKEIIMQGVGGRILGYIHNLKIKVAGGNFVFPVIFSYEYHVSYNLLGRKGFFENFKITFDEKNKIVELL